ncbi:unnamed protein product [Adineta steineri]|uniref:F-box domain-containing protein n=1 Tax=Adineta steineri TaxID=433720 RepID=A0A818W284_9BILA|nr:unnamed protein product [Adineta steineri]
MTRVEDLSNEIFLEIFNYLDSCDILKAFINLNIRFQRFITDSHLQLKVKLCPQIKSKSKQILLPHKSQIFSLYLYDHLIINQFFTLYPIDSSFNQLQTLNVQFIRADQFIQLLQDLPLLPCLFQLIIYLDDDQIDFHTIYSLIFNLPVLKYLKLSSLQHGRLSKLLFNPIKQSNSIKYLIIDHPCIDDDIIVLFSFLPHLRHLTCRKSLTSSPRFFKMPFPSIISDLTHLFIQQCDMEFADFEIFIQKISSQLHLLKIVTFNDPSYLDANRWERLILQNMLNLRKFYFEYHDYFDDNYKLTPYHRLSNQFLCSFWIERQWIFDISIDNFDIIYSIQPYRKKWFEFEVIENINSPIPLSVTNHLHESVNRTLINKINLFLIVFKITHLDVDCRTITISNLVKLIQQLSYLKFIRMSHLPLARTEYLINEKRRIIRLSQKNKNITRVNLEYVSQIEQIQFVHYLCPFMKYLLINCTNDIDPILLIQFIFKTNAKFIKYLILMCLCIPSTQNELIKKLREIIDSENYNYTIKHIDNKIYFHRKF